MSERQAKLETSKLLRLFTPGSILHLLADLHGDLADEARQQDDAVAYEQCRLVQHALFVVGLGIDAAKPS
jgi:hypothetical protein